MIFVRLAGMRALSVRRRDSPCPGVSCEMFSTLTSGGLRRRNTFVGQRAASLSYREANNTTMSLDPVSAATWRGLGNMYDAT